MDTVRSARKPGPDRRRWWVVVPALALAVLGWQAALLGLNELRADTVDADLTEWRERAAKTGTLPSEAEWNASRATIAKALEQDPSNPHHHEVSATVSMQIYRKGEGVASSAVQALPAMQSAMRLRPTSPYTWAQLAYVHYQLGKVDAAFYKALENAVHFGPGEREALLTVVDLGLAVLEQAPESTRQRILEAARHADRREANDVAAIAARRGKLEQVCKLPNTAKTSRCSAKPTPIT